MCERVRPIIHVIVPPFTLMPLCYWKEAPFPEEHNQYVSTISLLNRAGLQAKDTPVAYSYLMHQITRYPHHFFW